jgi:uncharacterized membrane protein YkvA (DUF1232 family)
MLESWKTRARALKQELYALTLACKDPRTPWYAKLLGILVLAYALSPIDLIPDAIPVIGYLDDLLLIPLGLLLLRRLIPAPILADARRRAAENSSRLPANRFAAAAIILLWLISAAALAWLLWRRFR